MISAFGVEHDDIVSKMSDTELRHRKRVQAGLSTAGAVIGLSALGAKGAKVGVKRFLKPTAKAVKVNSKIDSAVNNALVIGGGVGGAAGLNSAAISRAESKKPIKKDASDKTLLHQHGLRGAPKGVDRATRQRIWEARSAHLNRKRNRWSRTSQASNAAEKATGVVAGGVGAAVAGHQLREAYKAQHPQEFKRAANKVNSRVLVHSLSHKRSGEVLGRAAKAGLTGKPGFKTLAVGAGAAAATAGARRLRITADKKTRKYSSASGGIASGTARRMKDYDVSKSAFGVEHGEISKLGSPKVRIQTLTGISQQGNTITRHEPDHLDTKYKGKSAILRRPKYQVTASPKKFSAKTPGAKGAMVSPNLRARSGFAREVDRAYKHNSKTIDVNGRKMSHKVVKAFDPEARRHTELGAAAGASGAVAVGTGSSALRSGAKAARHYRQAAGNNKTVQGRLLDAIALKGAAAKTHTVNTGKTHAEMLHHVQEGNKLARRARGKGAVALGTAAAAGAIAHHSANGGATYRGPYQPKSSIKRALARKN